MASLADDYVDQMKHHPYGYALYHPVSTRDMRPGSVGFFDSLGVWNPIAHLEDSESLTRSGLRFPTRSLTVARTERIKEWTPKVSANVTETAGGVNLGASGAATGLPVDAKLSMEYGTSSNFGAVLITSSPVTHNGFHYQSPFQEWVKENAKALLHGPIAADVKEHGLFVVTQSYAAEKVALTAWRNSRNKAYFGFGVGAMDLAEISPHVQWYTGKSESGWNIHAAEPGELKVVFAAGLAYRRIWPLTGQLHRTNSPNRGSDVSKLEDRISVVGMDGKEIEFEGKAVGKSYESMIASDDEEEEDGGTDADGGT